MGRDVAYQRLEQSGSRRPVPEPETPSSPSRKCIKAADVIILFPLGAPDDEQEMDGSDLISDLLISGTQRGKDEFKELLTTCKWKRPKLKEVRSALLQDLCQFFPERGFTTRIFVSIDEDELFLRVAMEDDVCEAFYAQRQRVRLQTTKEILDRLQIDQPPPYAGEVVPCYIPYDPELVEQKSEELGLPTIFKKYYTRTEEGSVFRTVDRVRILEAVLGQSFKRGSAVERGIIKAYFPVHYKQTLYHFRVDWANFSCRTLLDPMWTGSRGQPLARIRNYFGEYYGFYFGWMSYTVKACTSLAFVGMCTKGIRCFPLSEDWDTFVDTVWVLFMQIFCIVYILIYKRLERRLAAEWDMEEYMSKAVVRPGYRGDWKPSPLNLRDRERQYPGWKKAIGVVFSLAITVAFLFVVFAAVLFIYTVVKPRLNDSMGHRSARVATSVIISVQIAICNQIYKPICKGLIWLENPRTMSEYMNRYIWKQFFFQFINSYQSFFYTLFIQPTTKYKCGHISCVEYSVQSLYVTFATTAAMALVNMARPYARMKYETYNEDRQLEEKMKAAGVPHSEKPQRSFMEKQAKMSTITVESQVDDMMGLIIPMGYVLLFGSIAPATSLFMLIIYIIRIRVDAWRLCTVMRRPYPMATNGLGAWKSVISVLANCGLLVSSSMLVMDITMNPLTRQPMTTFESWMLFFIIEHVVLLAHIFFDSIIPAKPHAVQLMSSQQEYVRNKLLLGTAEQEMPLELKKPVLNSRSSRLLPLTQKSKEWSEIDHEADDDDLEPQAETERLV